MTIHNVVQTDVLQKQRKNKKPHASHKTPKKQGRTQGKTAKKSNRKKTNYCASGVDEPTLLSFLVHSQQRNKGLHREDGEGWPAVSKGTAKLFDLTHLQYWATSLRKLAKRKGESSTMSFYFHEVLFITILTNLLRFLTQTAIYTNLKCFILNLIEKSLFDYR